MAHDFTVGSLDLTILPVGKRCNWMGSRAQQSQQLRHHRAQETLELARARGIDFALIDISHWAAEFVWLETARKELQEQLPQINFEVCDIRTDVFEFLMNKPKDSK